MARVLDVVLLASLANVAADRPKPPAADPRWFVLCLSVTAGDIALCVVPGSPSPLRALPVLIAALVARTRRLRAAAPSEDGGWSHFRGVPDAGRCSSA